MLIWFSVLEPSPLSFGLERDVSEPSDRVVFEEQWQGSVQSLRKDTVKEMLGWLSIFAQG
ncbi:hypothetical protein ACFX2I_039852 [Malus domestica]